MFSEQQMAEKRPNGCGAIARNRNPLMICAKNTTNNNNNYDTDIAVICICIVIV